MKRNADQTDFDDGLKKVKSDDAKAVGVSEFRFVIEKRQQGLLIGKGGAKITNVRQESGVFASILKVENQNAQERILVLQGTVEQCAMAWKLFGDVVAESQLANTETATTDAVTVKVLCDQTQIGSVIGKGGATIRQTQTDTGAKVQISNDPLPGSTEKTVSVTATTDVLQDGLLTVLAQLRDYPMRPGTSSIPFSPGATPMASANQYTAPFNSYGAPPGPDPNSYTQNPYSNGFGAGYGSFPATATPSPSAPKHTQKIVIPTVCAGGVIGKGGSRIREMQAQSGCTIRLADATTEMPTERVVTLEGSNEGIQIAIQMIRSAVEATAVVAQ